MTDLRQAVSEFVYRPLLIRLGIGGLAVSVLLGGLTFYYETERIDDLFVDFAVAEAHRFADEVPQLSNPETAENRAAIQRALDGPGDGRGAPRQWRLRDRRAL